MVKHEVVQVRTGLVLQNTVLATIIVLKAKAVPAILLMIEIESITSAMANIENWIIDGNTINTQKRK